MGQRTRVWCAVLFTAAPVFAQTPAPRMWEMPCATRRSWWHTSCLLKKMKKELPILRGHPERGEEISHADPEMFIMMIDRGRMVWLDL